jgi:hypothetical protein
MVGAPRDRRRRIPSPYRLGACLLAAIGALLVWMNRELPDESLYVGAVLALSGVALASVRETPGRRGAVEALLVLVLLFAGAECGLRWENARRQERYTSGRMRFVADPLLRYVLEPNFTDYSGGKTNSLGMFDVERAIERRPGTLRIACLGDSVGGDFELPRENACAALERRLFTARAGAPVEVLNFSVPGYNTIQEARALEVRALPFDPDAVVLLYVVNDPYPHLAIAHHIPGHLKFEHTLYTAARLAARQLRLGSDPMIAALHGLHEDPSSWDGVVVAGFDRIERVAESRRMPVVVAVFPVFVEGFAPALEPVYGRVVREAERHGFVGVDLRRAAFAHATLDDLLKPSRDSIHPNAHAHALAAHASADALLRARPEQLTR